MNHIQAECEREMCKVRSYAAAGAVVALLAAWKIIDIAVWLAGKVTP